MKSGGTTPSPASCLIRAVSASSCSAKAARRDKIGVGVLLGLDRMLGVEEVGYRLIGAGQLADHIRRRAERRAAEVEPLHVGGRLPRVGHDVEVEPVEVGQPGARKCLQAAQLALRLRPRRRPRRIVGLDQFAREGRHSAPCRARAGSRPRAVPELLLEQASNRPRAAASRRQPAAEQLAGSVAAPATLVEVSRNRRRSSSIGGTPKASTARHWPQRETCQSLGFEPGLR